MLGFVTRPTVAPRHTYLNIKETGVFTVNHIHSNIIKQAHQTSARYETETSEFDKVNLTETYIAYCKAPFVEEAHIKIACRYINEYALEENDTVLIVAAIESIHLPENSFTEDGWIDLRKPTVLQ